jgi:hypothetical protein
MNHDEQVCGLRASLVHGLDAGRARALLQVLEDELLVPAGLYLDGGLQQLGPDAGYSPEIAGVVTRADGRDLAERDRTRVELWLTAQPLVTEFFVGPLAPAGSPALAVFRGEGD